MFNKWFPIFQAVGDDTMADTDLTTGDNGPVVGKDLDYLMNKVVTDDNKLRIVITT